MGAGSWFPLSVLHMCSVVLAQLFDHFYLDELCSDVDRLGGDDSDLGGQLVYIWSQLRLKQPHMPVRDFSRLDHLR